MGRRNSHGAVEVEDEGVGGIDMQDIPDMDFTIQREEQNGLDQQYELPLEEAKKLIVISPNLRPSDDLLKQTVQLARSSRVPLWGVNIIPSRAGPRAYINYGGIMFALSNDRRGVLKNELVEKTIGEIKGDVCVVIRRITMKTGEVYEGIGAVVIDEQWDKGNATLKADTKAKRRAAYDAIAMNIGFPMYDEDIPEPPAKQEPIQQVKEVKADVSKTITKSDIMKIMVANGIEDDEFTKITKYQWVGEWDPNIVARMLTEYIETNKKESSATGAE